LIDGEIRFVEIGDPTSMEGEIVTTSGTRLVCEDDEITITWRVDPSNPSVSPGAFANWDVVWEFVSLSPDVGTFGSSEELGYVDWTSVPDQEYTLTLRYNPCWNRETTGLGLIQVGFAELGLTHDITVDTCPVQNCCDIEEECEPCCYRIENGVFFDGGWWIYLPIDDDIYALIKTTLRPDSRLICVGEGFSVEVFIGSRNSEPILVDVEIDTGAFLYAGSDPAADEEPDEGEAGGEVKWINRTEREYKVDLTIGCEPNEFANGINVIVTNKNPGGGTDADGPDFDYCTNDSGCECCCCKWCFRGCYFPIDPRACETNPSVEPEGPWTRIENYLIRVEASENVWIEEIVDDEPTGNFLCDTFEIRQVGESTHGILCDGCGCPRSQGIFHIPLQNYFCDNPQGSVFVWRAARMGFDPGTWNLDGFFWSPDPESVSDYTRTENCSRIEVSYNYVDAGVTYTVTASFDVVASNGEILDCVPENGGEQGCIEGEFI
jgi:hypothetical protein